jgi:hypothetical protein
MLSAKRAPNSRTSTFGLGSVPSIIPSKKVRASSSHAVSLALPRLSTSCTRKRACIRVRIHLRARSLLNWAPGSRARLSQGFRTLCPHWKSQRQRERERERKRWGVCACTRARESECSHYDACKKEKNVISPRSRWEL